MNSKRFAPPVRHRVISREGAAGWWRRLVIGVPILLLCLLKAESAEPAVRGKDTVAPLFRHGTLLRGEKSKERVGPNEPAVILDPEKKTAPADPGARRNAAIQRATTLASQGDFDGALRLADELQQQPEDIDAAHELRGTVLALKKDYPAAEASFRAMLKKGDGSPVAHFNVAEMVMLQGRYTEAEERFHYLEDVSRQNDPALADLCRFKRVVSLAASLRIPEAEALVTSIGDPTLASPAAQYARAVISCVRNNYSKAAEVILSARTQFPEEVENLYVDSFIEMGWGKRDEQGKFIPERQAVRRPAGGAGGAVVAGYSASETPTQSK